MSSVSHHRLDRRAFLRAAAATAALLSTTSLTRVAFAQQSQAEAFDYEVLTERMRVKAAEPFNAAVPELPKLFAGLDYDGYRKVQFDAQHARWLDNNSGFQVHAFPMGWLFKEPVGVFEVVDRRGVAVRLLQRRFHVLRQGDGRRGRRRGVPRHCRLCASTTR